MKAKSPKADSTTLVKVSKLLPLLNSANEREAQAAAAALAKYDLRDVAASLQGTSIRAAFDEELGNLSDQWARERQLRCEQLQREAQTLLEENSPLLTKVHRKSLGSILRLTLSANDCQARRDLDYWSDRLRVIRWQVTPHAKELETAVTVAAGHSQTAKVILHDVFAAKGRARLANEIAIAKTALIKAEAVLAIWPASNEIDETSPPKGAQ
jgi:hypothetical protein